MFDLSSRFVCRCLPAALLAVLAPAFGAVPALDAGIVCESVLVNDEEAHATCTLTASMATEVVRFEAHFLGSHDDSEVGLKLAELNGAPVECRAGSKTASRFEDGEVTLSCVFVAPADAAAGKLDVNMSLHHLQLNKTELTVESRN